MYINHNDIEEYPFYATFYRIQVDENLPLDQRVPQKVVKFETKCDMSEKMNSISNDTITIFFPFDAENDELLISLGDNVDIDSYGLTQKGKVLGVYPTQLNGVTVLCTRV